MHRTRNIIPAQLDNQSTTSIFSQVNLTLQTTNPNPIGLTTQSTEKETLSNTLSPITSYNKTVDNFLCQVAIKRFPKDKKENKSRNRTISEIFKTEPKAPKTFKDKAVHLNTLSDDLLKSNFKSLYSSKTLLPKFSNNYIMKTFSKKKSLLERKSSLLLLFNKINILNNRNSEFDINAILSGKLAYNKTLEVFKYNYKEPVKIPEKIRNKDCNHLGHTISNFKQKELNLKETKLNDFFLKPNKEIIDALYKDQPNKNSIKKKKHLKSLNAKEDESSDSDSEKGIGLNKIEYAPGDELVSFERVRKNMKEDGKSRRKKLSKKVDFLSDYETRAISKEVFKNDQFHVFNEKKPIIPKLLDAIKYSNLSSAQKVDQFIEEHENIKIFPMINPFKTEEQKTERRKEILAKFRYQVLYAFNTVKKLRISLEDFLELDLNNSIPYAHPESKNLFGAIKANDPLAARNIALQNLNTLYDVDEFKRTALHICALKNVYQLIYFFVSKGANLDSLDQFGRTPLHYAALYENTEVLLALLCEGADPFINDGNGKRAEFLVNKNKILEKLLKRAKLLHIVHKMGKEDKFYDSIKRGLIMFCHSELELKYIPEKYWSPDIEGLMILS